MSEQELHSADQLEAAFYRLDMDSSGSISKDELKALLGGKFDDGTLQQVRDIDDSSTSVFVDSRTLMGCVDPPF